MVKRSETKAKTKAKDENRTFIVNSLLFFMNHRQKSTALDSTFQMMLNYYNEETISEAKALLHNKIAPEKRFIKIKGVGKARETLKYIHDMIIEMDADPNNSISLVTENTDFPSLDLRHIDVASLYHKIIQLSKEVEQQREVKNCRCDEDNNRLASDLKSFRNELRAVAEVTKKSAKQMSEKLSNICSEINQTDMKLSSIKQDLSQMKQSVRINYLHERSRAGIVDTPANIQVSGGQEPQSGDDAVCGLNKTDKASDTNQPINDSRINKTEQECNQLDKWTTVVRKKRWCHKPGNAPDAKFKTVEIFVPRLKPDTRIVYLKKWFWDKFQNARSVRFQALRTRYDTYAFFKISAKLLDEGDVRCLKVLEMAARTCIGMSQMFISYTFRTTFLAPKPMFGATNQFR